MALLPLCDVQVGNGPVRLRPFFECSSEDNSMAQTRALGSLKCFSDATYSRLWEEVHIHDSRATR